MLENLWSAVGNPTSALGFLGSSFGPSSLVPIGIHHLSLSNLTTGCDCLHRTIVVIIIIPRCWVCGVTLVDRGLL